LWGNKIRVYRRHENLPSFRKRKIDQGPTIKEQYIKNVGHHLDLFQSPSNIMPAPESPQNRLKWHRSAVFNCYNFTVKNHIVSCCSLQKIYHIGKGSTYIFKPARIHHRLFPLLMELEPRAVIFKFYSYFAVLFHHSGNGSL